MATSGINPSFEGLSRSSGQVAYVLLRRLPLGIAASFDLHVLSTPPAFVLSHDQTLRELSFCLILTFFCPGKPGRSSVE